MWFPGARMLPGQEAEGERRPDGGAAARVGRPEDVGRGVPRRVEAGNGPPFDVADLAVDRDPHPPVGSEDAVVDGQGVEWRLVDGADVLLGAGAARREALPP